jgi:quinol monooxygenase YgiN
LLAAPPDAYSLDPAAFFKRPGLTSPPSGALIVLTTIEYRKGTTSEALKGWKELLSHAENEESGALAFDVIEDVKESKVHTVQVFESAKSADAHVKGEAIKANREQNGSLRTGEKKIVRVKIAYGFLGK